MEELIILEAYLSEEHRKMLREESGISELAINSRGYYTETDSAGLEQLGFDENQKELVPALVIPVRDVTGEVVLHRIRPDKPRPNIHRPGKVNKYEMPTGSSIVLDVPPFTFKHLQNVSVPLWFCEGERKCDALISRGIAAISLPGVWAWKRNGLPLPDFDDIPMIGRELRAMFDSDAEEKTGIRQALVCLARYLKGRAGDA